jgi:hypothetical protein
VRDEIETLQKRTATTTNCTLFDGATLAHNWERHFSYLAHISGWSFRKSFLDMASCSSLGVPLNRIADLDKGKTMDWSPHLTGLINTRRRTVTNTGHKQIKINWSCPWLINDLSRL